MSTDVPQEDGEQFNAFNALIGRALIDSEFRELLRYGDSDKRNQALMEMDIETTPELLKALDDALGAVEQLAAEFGDTVAMT